MKVYRVGEWSGGSYTASEIVEYEIRELGNSLNIEPSTVNVLARHKVAGKDLLWVCLTREAVARYARYGEVIELEIPNDSMIIGWDDDGGYLVWLGINKWLGPDD